MTTRIRVDEDNEFDWFRITDTLETRDRDYLDYRVIEYDNGVVREEDYAVGTILTASVVDPTGAQEGGLKPWQTINTLYYYDVLLKKTTLFDDGVTEERDYSAGVLLIHDKRDYGLEGERSDTHDWHRKAYVYDPNNLEEWLTQSLIVMDDGLDVQHFYRQGQLDSILKRDLTPDGLSSSKRPWREKGEHYDADGNIVLTSYVHDNMVGHVKSFEDGKLNSILRTDFGDTDTPDGVKDWSYVATNFDEGGLVGMRRVKYDDGDFVSVLFENGVRTSKLQFDGDDDESWLLREFIYDSDGNVTQTNFYDTLDDASEQYILPDDLSV